MCLHTHTHERRRLLSREREEKNTRAKQRTLALSILCAANDSQTQSFANSPALKKGEKQSLLQHKPAFAELRLFLTEVHNLEQTDTSANANIIPCSPPLDRGK